MSLKTARSSQMDFVEIRRTAIVALFSDDTLFELLVLKKCDALALVYGLGSRASLDVDMSIDGDFKETTQDAEYSRHSSSDSSG
jgi:hypothetical protein